MPSNPVLVFLTPARFEGVGITFPCGITKDGRRECPPCIEREYSVLLLDDLEEHYEETPPCRIHGEDPVYVVEHRATGTRGSLPAGWAANAIVAGTVSQVAGDPAFTAIRDILRNEGDEGPVADFVRSYENGGRLMVLDDISAICQFILLVKTSDMREDLERLLPVLGQLRDDLASLLPAFPTVQDAFSEYDYDGITDGARAAIKVAQGEAEKILRPDG